MEKEIDAAAYFWSSQLRTTKLTQDQVSKFKECLIEAMIEKYTGHWYPDVPDRGQGYRSILFDNVVVDPILIDAAEKAKINDFRSRLPQDTDLVMFVDPGNVTVKNNNAQSSHALYSDTDRKNVQSVLKPLQKSAGGGDASGTYMANATGVNGASGMATANNGTAAAPAAAPPSSSSSSTAATTAEDYLERTWTKQDDK